METPSSTRRSTRSPALAASNNNVPTSKKMEDSEKIAVSNTRKRIGSQPLFDITNDSPIIGLAMGKVNTPSSASALARTPGSGEALLRDQVNTLLQRVEEEAEFSKISSINRPFLHLKSPAGLLAPTPANTPHVLTLSGEEYFQTYCLTSVTASPVQEQLTISKIVREFFDEYKQEGPESEKNFITRSLLLDFSEKSDGSDSSLCSSVLTREEKIESKENSSPIEDDDDSVWSIQVNSSARGEEEEKEDSVIEDIGEENNEDYCDCEAEKVYYDDEGSVDALCEEMNKIRVYGGEKKIPIFAGRHTRFVYNSDDELVEGEEKEEGCGCSGILKLKGLPTPKGKHYRFPEEMGDEEN